MRNQPWLQRCRCELTQQNLTRGLIQCTVHEDHHFGCGDFFRHIRRPLVIAEHAHSRIITPPLFGPPGKKRTDAIILAQRIPTSENQTTNLH